MRGQPRQIPVEPEPPPSEHGCRCTERGRARGPAPTRSLSDVVGWFKSLTTTRYIDGVRNAGWEPFCGRLWQRNYHDRIIRDMVELGRIRDYTRGNPADWEPGTEPGRPPGR
jgi:hypothetical protein